jgi:hypothetical protein
MAKRKRRRKNKQRNFLLAFIAKNDPTKLRDRVVRPERGKGRKDRPRDKCFDDFFDCAA